MRKMIERTKGQVIVVADHSKWGAVSNFPVANISEIDKLVSDDGFGREAMKDLSEHAVEVLLARNEKI